MQKIEKYHIQELKKIEKININGGGSHNRENLEDCLELNLIEPHNNFYKLTELGEATLKK